MANVLQPSNLAQTIDVGPRGPGALLADVVDETPQGLKKVVRGDFSRGELFGALTATPEVSISPNVQNELDNVVGLPAEIKGTKQPQTYEVEISAEIVRLDRMSLKYMHPGLEETNWVDAQHAGLAVKTGNAQFNLTAKSGGTGGNAISLTMTAPATANTAIAVSVSGSAITVSLATGATASVSTSTANAVIAAINAHASASALVRAGLPSTSDGTGVVDAQAATNLTGGTAGVKVGTVYSQRGYWLNSEYIPNMYFILPTAAHAVYAAYKFKNCISQDDFNPSYDDEGQIVGVGCTWRAHVDFADYDPELGVYKPAYEFRLLDPSAAV